MKLRTVFLFFLVVALPSQARAQVSDAPATDQAVTSEVDADDTSCADISASQLLVKPNVPITYELIENDPIDAVVTLRIRLLETGVKDGKLNLHGIAYPDAVANIIFATSVDLKEGEDTIVTVKAEDILWPGVRTATICLRAQFRFEDEERDKKLGETLVQKSVDVKFDVRTLPSVTSLQEKIDLSVVKCRWDWSCSLAKAISPGLSTTTENWIVGFRNDSLAAVTGTPLLLVHRPGEPTQNDALELEGKTVLAIGEVGRYTLKLASDPGLGKLDGNVIFRARPDGEKPLPGRKDSKGITRNETETSVVTSISVRAGIAVPILMLFLGIVAGRMNRQLSSPETQARLKLVDRMYEASDKIELLRDQQSKEFMRRRIAKIQRDLNETTITNESIDEELSQMRRQVYMFQLIDDLVPVSTGKPVSTLADQAREFIRQGKLKEAEAKRIEILSELEQSDVASGKFRSLKPLGADVSGETEKDRETEPLVRNRADRAAGFMAWLAGTRTASTKMLYRYIQPLATISLLIALVALGLFTFYSGPEHNTFGESLIGDYLPLFLWGFGTDVLSKRLTDITISK